MNAQVLRLATYDWLVRHVQGGLSGRMFRGFSLPKMGGTSRPLSDNSQDGTCPCQPMDGATEASYRTNAVDMDWPTECLTLNTREFPDFQAQSRSADGAFSSLDTVASLTEVLWTGSIPLRYYLTEKACRGILRRAENRGKTLPDILREEHPTWVPGWLDELGPIKLTLWGCPECAEWHTPRAWNDIQVRRTIETKLLAVLDGDKINKKERRGGSGLGISEEPVAYTNTAKDVHGVATDTHGAYTEHLTVRRLLPVETERLMGFPDNWTRIPWRGKPAEKCPDAPRYKACGNSMCVNCMEWIGERIEKVERALQEEGR